MAPFKINLLVYWRLCWLDYIFLGYQLGWFHFTTKPWQTEIRPKPDLWNDKPHPIAAVAHAQAIHHVIMVLTMSSHGNSQFIWQATCWRNRCLDSCFRFMMFSFLLMSNLAASVFEWLFKSVTERFLGQLRIIIPRALESMRKYDTF